MIRTNRDRLGNSSCRCNRLAKTLAFAIELGILSCRGYGKLVVAIHRQRLSEINLVPSGRDALEVKYGRLWSTSELTEEFEVVGFLAPLVVVRRRSDGQMGSLEFQGTPRFYFNFVADQK